MVLGCLVCYAIYATIFVAIIYLAASLLIKSPGIQPIKHSHILITGASKGIGAAMAKEAVLQGASVTLVARTAITLQKLKESLLQRRPQAKVEWFTCDLANAAQSELNDIVREAESRSGPIDVLINNLGGAKNRPFEDLSLQDFDDQVHLNFLSTVGMTKAVVPGMKARKGGRIAIVSSMAGELGVYGFSAYSSVKAALRGFAEALQMELKPHDIYITVVYPPATETDGLHEQYETMPAETKAIITTPGVYDANVVAKRVLDDVSHGRYTCWTGLNGWMLANLCAGGCSVTSPWDAVQQILLMSPFRFVALFYIRKFDNIVKKTKKE